MQATNLGAIKAALWEQAFVGGTQVRCPMGQVVAIRKRNGQLQAMIRGWGRWYPVESVSIDRMFVGGGLENRTLLVALLLPDLRKEAIGQAEFSLEKPSSDWIAAVHFLCRLA